MEIGGSAESQFAAAEADPPRCGVRDQLGAMAQNAVPLANDAAREAKPPGPQTLHIADLVQLSRAATPHTRTGPALPNGAPFGPVISPSLANFKMRNSSVRRPR